MELAITSWATAAADRVVDGSKVTRLAVDSVMEYHEVGGDGCFFVVREDDRFGRQDLRGVPAKHSRAQHCRGIIAPSVAVALNWHEAIDKLLPHAGRLPAHPIVPIRVLQV